MVQGRSRATGGWQRDADAERSQTSCAKREPGCTRGVGCVPRIFGCANDFTEDDGPVWESNNLQLLDRSDPVWQVYVGGLGFPDSGDVPANKESWTTEPNLSATWWSRLFRYLNLSCCCQAVVEDDAPPVPRISPIFSSSSSSSVR